MHRLIAAAFTAALVTGVFATSAIAAPNKPQIGAWGFDLAGMDTSVKPGDDFNRYANGRWYDAATLPPDRPTVGSFTDLTILSETRMLAILHDLDARAGSLSPDEQKVRDLYHSYIDTDRLEQLGLSLVHGVSESRPAGLLKGHVRGVHRVRLAVVQRDPDADHRVAGHHALLHLPADALLH